MANKKIGAIIITFNNVSDTLYIVDSLLSSDYENIDLLVVDNKSDGIYRQKLASELNLKFPKANYLYIDEDKGYGGACNIGAKYLCERGSDILLFLNNDISLDKSCISKLVENISGNIVLAGPKIYIGFSNILYSAGGFFDKQTLILNHRDSGKIYKGQYETKEEVDFINGSIFMISAQIFSQIGGFDERFYFYYEETDLCYRILKAGYKMVYEPQALAHHFVSKTMGRESEREYYFMARSMLLFVTKHSKSKMAFLSNLFKIVNIFILKLSYRRIKQLVKLIYAVIRGITDFAKGKTDKGPY